MAAKEKKKPGQEPEKIQEDTTSTKEPATNENEPSTVRGEGARDPGVGEEGGATEGGGSEGGTGGQNEGAADLLAKIRARRADQASNGLGATGDGKDGKDVPGGEGHEGGNAGSRGRVKGNDGATTKPNRGNGSQVGATGNNRGGSGQTSQRGNGSGGQEVKGDKGDKGGLGLVGFKGGNKSAPVFQTPALQEVLTAQEAKEYKEKMMGVFLTLFRLLDQGITATNRDRAQAVIWSDMDDEDLGVLVEVTIGGARKSRIVATGVRQLSKAHNLFRLGLITGPRFIATAKHYADHGGFVFPFFGGRRTEVANQ